MYLHQLHLLSVSQVAYQIVNNDRCTEVLAQLSVIHCPDLEPRGPKILAVEQQRCRNNFPLRAKPKI